MAFRLWYHQSIMNSSTSFNYSWTKPFICTPQGLAELKAWRKNDFIPDQNMPASRRLHFTFLAKRQKKVTPLSWGTCSRLLSFGHGSVQSFCLGHSSVQGCWSSLLAQNESKAQLFPGLSGSFWNSPMGTGPRAELHTHRGLALLWALLAETWWWPGQDGRCSPLKLHLQTGVWICHCWGELPLTPGYSSGQPWHLRQMYFCRFIMSIDHTQAYI